MARRENHHIDANGLPVGINRLRQFSTTIPTPNEAAVDATYDADTAAVIGNIRERVQHVQSVLVELGHITGTSELVEGGGEVGLPVEENPPAPGAPTNLAAVSSSAQVTLTWDAAPGATGYRVYRGGVLHIELGDVRTLIDGGLTNGNTYDYWVTGFNAGGESTTSNQVTGAPVAPGPPTDYINNMSTVPAEYWSMLGTAQPTHVSEKSTAQINLFHAATFVGADGLDYSKPRDVNTTWTSNQIVQYHAASSAGASWVLMIYADPAKSGVAIRSGFVDGASYSAEVEMQGLSMTVRDYKSGNTANAQTTVTVSQGWHVIGVRWSLFSSSGSHTVFVDGTQATPTSSASKTGATQTQNGGMEMFLSVSGAVTFDVAHLAIWHAQLSNQQMADIATEFSDWTTPLPA